MNWGQGLQAWMVVGLSPRYTGTPAQLVNYSHSIISISINHSANTNKTKHNCKHIKAQKENHEHMHKL